jgi:hypothetical protein
MAQGLRAALFGLLLTLATLPGLAEGVTITFEATDLADVIGGEDLWRYTYRVSDFDPRQDVAFETLFDPALHSGLEDPPPAVSVDWDVITLPPDPALPDDGRYSALALVDGADLALQFPVTFVWLGGAGTAPGSQPFEIVQFDEVGNFIATLETGDTTPFVPPTPVSAPATLALAAVGLAGLLLARRRA